MTLPRSILGLLLNTVQGTTTIRSPKSAFLAAFAQRIESGLFEGSPRRSRYAITEKNADGLRFRATDWLTAINIGLNDVDLSVTGDGSVRYRIRFVRWSMYVLALGAAIGLMIIISLLLLDMPRYIAEHPQSSFPGLSIRENVAIAWALALFWGFVWPWILIAIHRRTVRRVMERLIAERDARPPLGGR